MTGELNVRRRGHRSNSTTQCKRISSGIPRQAKWYKIFEKRTIGFGRTGIKKWNITFLSFIINKRTPTTAVKQSRTDSKVSSLADFRKV